MKGDDFLHLLTRVVNSKAGPRFLEILHELREVLEEAGIAEEAEPKIEPGKPIRQRNPEEIARRPKRSFPLEPSGPGEEAAPPPGEERLETPEAPGGLEAAEMPAEETVEAGHASSEEPPATLEPALPEEPAVPGLAEETSIPEAPREFIEAGPNRLVRKSESTVPPTPGKPSPRPRRGEPVRAIVLSALLLGDKTMGQLQEIVREKKGEVSHIYQQVYSALRQVQARKTAEGKYTLSPEDSAQGKEGQAPSPTQEPLKQLSLLESIPDSPAAAAIAPVSEGDVRAGSGMGPAGEEPGNGG